MKFIDQNGHALDDLVVSPTGRTLMSALPKVATTITTISNTAYFVYVGRVLQPLLVKYVELYVATGGTVGAGSAEVGLFSTPNAPNRASQVVSKLAVDGSFAGFLGSAGLKRSTNPFNVGVQPGTYLWAGVRTALFVQPALSGLCMDYGEGMVLANSDAGLLTGAGPWTSAVPALGLYLHTAIAPDLRITLD